MSPSNIELLRHILDEIIFITENTKGKSKDEFVSDAVLTRAVIRGLEIIGEAATKVDAQFKAKYSHIEWRKMAGTRNRFIHDYFGVDYDIVWDIITTKLSALETGVRDILEN